MSRRAAALAVTNRFVDEVLSGAWDVLTPTFRRAFGLSLFQVGLLDQVLTWVAFVVEPISAALIDVRSRRVLMTFGACTLAAALIAMGAAWDYGALLAGFALYGVGSGPLTHTGDVVVIESFPDAPDRAYTWSTFLDTVGALIGPALVAAATAAGVSYRVVLVGLGVLTLGYAYALGATRLPSPKPRPEHASVVRTLIANARRVLADAGARRALVMLLCFDLFEAAFVLEYVWLHETVGLSQALVAVYAAAAQVVDLVALAWLDRRIEAGADGATLRGACVALVVLPAAWVAAPGIAGRIVVGVPLSFAFALVWPLAKSRSLLAVPDAAGATQAITALFSVVPFELAVAWIAQQTGIGVAMAGTAALGAAAMLLATATNGSSRR